MRMMRMADLLDGWRWHLERRNLDQLWALMVVHEFLILSRRSKWLNRRDRRAR
jgi:hypothetical protein